MDYTIFSSVSGSLYSLKSGNYLDEPKYFIPHAVPRVRKSSWNYHVI